MSRYFISAVIALLAFTVNSYAQTVTLDTYFNQETRKTKNGMERFHYLWNDNTDPGFSKWGDWFKAAGFKLDTLGETPTVTKLEKSSVYITATTANEIAKWVKAGGVLLLMANDSTNVNLPGFNILANKFGLHFNDDMANHVIDDKHFADGEASFIDRVVFPSKPNVFLKDVCSISLNNPAAKGVIKSADGSTVIAATVTYGKGIVFAVGDPWLYNEYVNGRLPAVYQNDIAAKELTNWLKKQSITTK
jgi:hypothetical protein